MASTHTPHSPGKPRGFKTFFLRGLGVLLPSVLTLWLFWTATIFIYRHVASPINSGIREAILVVVPRAVPAGRLPDWFVVTDTELAEERARLGSTSLSDHALRIHIQDANFRDYWNAHWYLRLIGFGVAIILIYTAGVVLGGFLGRGLHERIDRRLMRLPLVKHVYPSVKQLVDHVLGDRRIAFSRVVLVEYPRRGVWSLGLVTGPAIRGAVERTGVRCATVFFPHSPTPFTGYAVTVPEDDLIDMPISIDEALKFVVSGGVLSPGRGEPGANPALPGSPAPAPQEALTGGARQ